MRNRQYLGCLRVRDERRSPSSSCTSPTRSTRPAAILPDKLPASPSGSSTWRSQLIEGFSGEWEPEKYKDTYTDRAAKVVDAKLRGTRCTGRRSRSRRSSPISSRRCA